MKKTHYNSSTLCVHDEHAICASYPILDEKMKFCGCNVIYEGFEKTRVEKVENIWEFAERKKQKITLRVCCVEREDEASCCKC